MEKIIEKASILVEALPYINRFRGTTMVIKYGGSAMLDPEKKKLVVQDIVLLSAVGIKPIIVHGGGREINEISDRLGVKTTFVQGLRVTDSETAQIAEMVLMGKINRELVAMINESGAPAVGLSGKDGGLVHAVRKKPVTITNEEGGTETVDLGFVGEVTEINPRILYHLEEGGFIPVIAPTAPAGGGETLNINADTVAGALAGCISAGKLVFLSDQRGILADKDDETTLIHQIREDEIDGYIESGVIAAGMIPKIEACRTALDGGVGEVHIIDGRVRHSLLLEIFTRTGIGTMITACPEQKKSPQDGDGFPPG